MCLEYHYLEMCLIALNISQIFCFYDEKKGAYSLTEVYDSEISNFKVKFYTFCNASARTTVYKKKPNGF